MKKFKLYGLVIALTLALSIVGSAVVVKAQGGSSTLDKVVELLRLVKELDDNSSVGLQDVGAFISSGTNLTDLAVANDLTVGAQLTVTATTTLSGYADGVFYYEDATLVDTTSTMAYVCNNSGQDWSLQRVQLLVPGSASGGGADAFATRVIDFSVSANQYSSSTAPFAYNLSYATSTSQLSFSWDKATSTVQTTATIVQDSQCVTSWINKAASSTISTNTDGIFQVWYKKLN